MNFSTSVGMIYVAYCFPSTVPGFHSYATEEPWQCIMGYQTQDANALVLRPVERMIEKDWHLLRKVAVCMSMRMMNVVYIL